MRVGRRGAPVHAGTGAQRPDRLPKVVPGARADTAAQSTRRRRALGPAAVMSDGPCGPHTTRTLTVPGGLLNGAIRGAAHRSCHPPRQPVHKVRTGGMKTEPAHSDTSRVDTGQRVFLNGVRRRVSSGSPGAL
ncbi:hypothetical protein GCM10009665_26980 [Kitasatospora nipponensis]|uniref:Uncharacterized protein n=1 Tax=Kitasatospora nipponensis TaxID=258049 RepID=A0ABP4GRE6_9ACTN